MTPGFRRSLSSPSLFVILAFAYPASYLFERNHLLYQGTQLVAASLVLLLAATSTALLVRLLAAAAGRVASRAPIFRRATAMEAGTHRVGNAVQAAAGGAILLLMLSWPVSELLHDSDVPAAGWLVAVVLCALLGYYVDLIAFNVVLLGLTLVNGARVVAQRSRSEPKICEMAAVTGAPVTFRTRPDVYLVLLESYNGLDVRSRVYGIDNGALTDALRGDGYTIYDSVFANYFTTLTSLSATMLMAQHHYAYRGPTSVLTYRKIIGGAYENPVLETFARNGYEIDYSGFGEYLFYPSAMLDRTSAKQRLQPLEVFSKLIALKRSVLPVVRKLESELWPGPHSGQAARGSGVSPGAARDRSGPARKRPVFTMLYTGAAHSPMYISDFPRDMEALPGFRDLPVWRANLTHDYWVSTYRRLADSSDSVLIELAGRLAREDPTAVVILLGDHGAWLHREQWIGAGGDPNRAMREHGVSPSEVTRDLEEVFLAIRWPAGQPPRVITPVNLFRAVFAALAGREAGDDHAPNDSFVLLQPPTGDKVYRTVRDGKLLDQWELVSGAELNAGCR
ncbi:MAG: hypothetical protein ABR998_12495 [Gemmatimonadales bacterium]|jgi:hypothetical protein